MTNESMIWILSGPSRRLRKLYAELADVEKRQEQARISGEESHVVTHQLAQLRQEHNRILRRIERHED